MIFRPGLSDWINAFNIRPNSSDRFISEFASGSAMYLKLLRDQDLRFEFEERSSGLVEKVGPVTICQATFTLGDVARNGYRRPSHLAHETIQLLFRKILSFRCRC